VRGGKSAPQIQSANNTTKGSGLTLGGAAEQMTTIPNTPTTRPQHANNLARGNAVSSPNTTISYPRGDYAIPSRQITAPPNKGRERPHLFSNSPDPAHTGDNDDDDDYPFRSADAPTQPPRLPVSYLIILT
jgi:hypothetical protein